MCFVGTINVRANVLDEINIMGSEIQLFEGEESAVDDKEQAAADQSTMCTALFGDPTVEGQTAYYLQVALNLLKYVGIICCIALTVVEFMKAVIADNKEMLKPLGKKAFSRLCYAVALFFLPIITSFILKKFVATKKAIRENGFLLYRV